MSAAPEIRSLTESVENESQAGVQLSFGATIFPVLIRPQFPMTEDELLSFCRLNKGYQIACDPDGTLHVMTPAGARTSRLHVYLNRELDLWAEADGRGFVFGSDLGVRFPDRSMRAPDAAWTSRMRFEALSEDEQQRFLPFCPEFVVKLRSPSDRISQTESKMEFWMSRGAQLGWLIDPQRKLATIYRPAQDPETRPQPEILQGEGPINGFSLKMQRFWE
jgi:Uma2 family endonuclease